jgi:hypothetical protein
VFGLPELFCLTLCSAYPNYGLTKSGGRLMLSKPAPFPHPGCIAYLAFTAQACRVLQHRLDAPDGPAVLVSIPEQRCCHPVPLASSSAAIGQQLASSSAAIGQQLASSSAAIGQQRATTRTVPLAELFPDRDTALHGTLRKARQRRKLGLAFPTSSPRA